MNKLLLICIVALTIPATFSKVTKCYQCQYFEHDDESSSNVQDCENNPPQTKYLIDCAKTIANESQPTSWQCLKISGRVEVDEENYSFVRRQCVPGDKSEVDCKNTKSFQISEEHFVKRGKQCYCDEKDGCNTGFSLQAASLLTFTAAASIVAFSKY